MISHLLKPKSALLVLFFLICSIPYFSCTKKDEIYYYNLGITYAKSGRHQEAIEAYKQAISIKPDYVDAHYSLGVVYYGSGKYQEAIGARYR
jgi:tetratricopeptide (TPR) repeat protein